HLPDLVLSPGNYKWDVFALNENGKVVAKKGEASFSISNKFKKLPWIQPEELLGRVPKEHSRIQFMRSDLPQIKQRLNTTHKTIWNNIKNRADESLDKPAPEYPTYHLTTEPTQRRMEYLNYFQYFRGFIDNSLYNLSLAYLMSGEKKYAVAAKRILFEVTEWPTDYDDVSSVAAEWGDEVGLSMSRYAHKVYDWLYDALSTSEKERVLKMCEGRAWQTYNLLNDTEYFTYPGRSHPARLIAYLSEMAIAMAGEVEGPEIWLGFSLKALTTFYPHWGGIDGGWAEGVPYGLWYNNFYIPAFDTLESATDFNLWKRPFFNRIRYFYLYCTSPLAKIRPFGDSAEAGGPNSNQRDAFIRLMDYHANRFEDEYIAWWVNQVPSSEGFKDINTVIFNNLVIPKPPVDLPNSKVFRGVGWAGLHSNLSDPGNDTFMVFKSSPYGSVSHSHADQNSFVIFKGGVALAIPSGYYGPSYGMPHHAEWTRSTKANNSVLVNGEGQEIRDDKATGTITYFEDKEAYTYLIADASAAYKGRLKSFKRHILFLRPGIFLLLDQLEAPSEANFQWMLHAFDKMNVADRKVISQKDGARLSIWFESLQNLEISQTDKFDTAYNTGIPEEFHEQVENHWHVTVETNEKALKSRIAAIMVVDTLKDSIEIDLLSTKGWFGVKANGSFGQVEGWIQFEPGSKIPRDYIN
ncbi:MAG: heparinase II/III family protein, partial [Bacteroidales bacterium]|nr:heparinase II/III family protein [Bacteroidales bacterium]